MAKSIENHQKRKLLTVWLNSLRRFITGICCSNFVDLVICYLTLCSLQRPHQCREDDVCYYMAHSMWIVIHFSVRNLLLKVMKSLIFNLLSIFNPLTSYSYMVMQYSDMHPGSRTSNSTRMNTSSFHSKFLKTW